MRYYMKGTEMDEKIEVTETTTLVDVSLRDQVAVTVLSALAGLLASKLTERGYYAAKARWQVRNSASH